MTNVPVPGTVHLVDLEGTSNLRHDGSSQRDIILVPQPTSDPNDPLNWSPKRRLNSTVWQMIWTFFGSCLTVTLTPAYLLIQEDTGITVADLNTGTALMYLFFGFGNLLTQPIALNFGRRPSAVVSLFIASFLVLWSSFMKTAAEWYANRILLGIAFSGIESLIELCIADTKFSHERGFHMGFYNWTLWCGAFLGPIPAGFLADAAGWRWINRMYFIMGIVTSIGVFLFFEETMFYRPDGAGEFMEGGSHTAATDESDKSPTGTERESGKQLHDSESQPQVAETCRVKSYWQKLKLWGYRDPRQPNTFFKFFFLPFYLLRYPSIVFSGFLVGSVLAWYNTLLGTITPVFGSEPYNFNANMIGLVYIACIAGTTVGCIVAGTPNDMLATFLARRNHGVKEPEARLWGAVVPMIAHPAGCLLYGIGAAHHIHWVGLCFGIGMVTVSLAQGSTLALTYVVDCYREITGEALITVIIIRNCIGFAFGYAVSPMVDSLGLQGAFILIAFLGMALTGTSFIMVAFGKRMRQSTAASYWKLVEEHGFRAH